MYSTVTQDDWIFFSFLTSTGHKKNLLGHINQDHCNKKNLGNYRSADSCLSCISCWVDGHSGFYNCTEERKWSI